MSRFNIDPFELAYRNNPNNPINKILSTPLVYNEDTYWMCSKCGNVSATRGMSLDCCQGNEPVPLQAREANQ